MASRENILAKVRSGVAAGASVVDERTEGERQKSVASRLADKRRNLIPERASDKSPDELAALLKKWIEMAGGEVLTAASERDVGGVIADFLRRHNQPSRLRIGADARLAEMLSSATPLEIEKGPAEPADATGVTLALAAVAETGTLVVASGPGNPVTLSFLPENNIVVVDRNDIVGPLEEAFARVRARADEGSVMAMPRTLNLISGPSRSADIGGVPVLGAHGPRRLAVLVVG